MRAPDVDALVAQLRARVDERRRQGAYPPGFEDGLNSEARLLLNRRVHSPRPFDVAGPLARLRDALPISLEHLPDTPQPSGRSARDRVMAAVVRRQTQGVVDQVEGFAEPVADALAALAAAVEDLAAAVKEFRPPLHAVLERQAVEERLAVQAAARLRGSGCPRKL